MNCEHCQDTKKLCQMNCYSPRKPKYAELVEGCEDCMTCHHCKDGLKFQAVLQARIGVEVVGELVFETHTDRTLAEFYAENAQSHALGQRYNKVLTNLFPKAIIVTVVKQLKGPF